MFKKVLPSRRTTATDESPFEIVTPAPGGDRRDGKENVPQAQAQRSAEGSKSWYNSGRGSVDLGPRTRKKSSAKAPQLEPQMTGGTTNVAFERMLVSIPAILNYFVHLYETSRMTFKSHLLFESNSPRLRHL